MIKDFLSFLKEFKVIALAVAFVIGNASTNLIKSLVDNILMPIISPWVAGGWKEAVLNIGPISLRWGAFLGELINFFFLALIIFIVAKKIIKDEELLKK